MIEVKDLHIAIDGRSVVSGLSFMAADRQILCLSGPSREAAGTLLRVVMGLEKVKSGFVSIEGELLTPSSAAEFRKSMAYLPENPEMPCPTMRGTARMICGLQANMAKGLTTGDIAEEMRLLGLPDSLLDKPREQLTRQETVTALLAIICAHGKQIILADNPTAGLDGAAAQAVAQYLRRKADGGAAVVVATDDSAITQVSEQTIHLNAIE